MRIRAKQPDLYFEISLEVSRDVYDIVCDFIITNICSGLVLEDEEDAAKVRLRFYVPDSEAPMAESQLVPFLRTLDKVSPHGTPELEVKPMRDADWQQQYRESVRPLYVGGDIVIRPPWYGASLDAAYDIILQPEMAFGTGRHETTRSCLRLLRRQFRSGARFLDVGCGSGILSILCSKLGASYVKAVDCDATAVATCRDNFRINRVPRPYDVTHGSIDSCEGDEPYDFVCANIIKSTILPMLPRLKALTSPSGLLILSGLLSDDERDVEAHLGQNGLRLRSLLRDNEWITMTVSPE